ncbi:hypothetical protein HYC85_006111 [Camellia sinensis]|uniref:NADP-dependent oxidoreductase domain-containing protein n=1 Tax=Camellia sinensis TaxID=4442 RepID=A0A7J7I352_CAMSI|nr:hypothetical protein HYC85_006111 [Camellia sinensis]
MGVVVMVEGLRMVEEGGGGVNVFITQSIFIEPFFMQVSKLGYGCMGLTGIYNSPVSEEDGIAIIKYAYSRGITFFDTSDIYGVDHANEILVGKALKQLPREKIELATKFGIAKIEPTQVVVKGTPEYVRSCCEASLRHLGVDYIDLYYVDRIDTSVPIEETSSHLKLPIVQFSSNLVPIFSFVFLFILGLHILVNCALIIRELGIGIVPYAPTARGFFGGKAAVESVPANSFLESHPRFTGLNLEQNKIFYTRIEALAKKHGCSAIQLALTWVLHQGDGVVPIPGTTKIKNLDENIGAVRVKLDEDGLKEISDAVPLNEVAGIRTHGSFYNVSYKFSDTPLPKDAK